MEATDGTHKCGTEIAGKFPTNLKAHIKGSHPAVYEQMLKKEAEKQKEREARVRKLASPLASHVAGQMTLVGTIQKTKPYKKDSTRYKKALPANLLLL